jgi:NTF2-related export protein 1/2
MNSCARYVTSKADISVNGLVCQFPAEYEALLEQQGNGVHYDVESTDCHVINPDFTLDAPDDYMTVPANSRVQVLCNVTGRVQYGRGKDAQQQTFNETFVLIPNWDAVGRNAPRNAKQWLIMSQNFRAL